MFPARTRSRSWCWGLFALGLSLAACCAVSADAQIFDEKFELWPTDLTIHGTVIACAEGEVPSKLAPIFQQASGGDDGVVVVLRFGDEHPDFQDFTSAAQQIKQYNFAVGKQPTSEQLAALLEDLSAATGVLIVAAGDVHAGDDGDGRSYVEAVRRVVEDGGVVCAIGGGALQLADQQWMGDAEQPSSRGGWQLLPDSVLFDASRFVDDPVDSMLEVLEASPTSVGMAIPRDTAIVLEGRKIRVYGEGKASFVLAANERQPARVQHVGAIRRGRFDPYRHVIDLTAWRRDALERRLPPFPPAQPPTPRVDKGSLIIVGGGGMPKGLMERMVELAGGEQAKMVFVPCSEQQQVSSDEWIVRKWKAMGVASAVVLHTKDRHRANGDDAFLEPLKQATGIWFGGGRQWNLADSYYGTESHRLMKKVLRRGGVVGGSSAGASIQAGYLARANPVANFDIMAPGYERGLGFIRGVAIDQHFSQRGRQKDMTQLVERYPQLLGIGIDETTALVVQQSVAEVVGKGQVYFYDRQRPVVEGEPDYVAVPAGERFDLAKRKTL
ncbi:Type 1 glutamine amidotransferase-like domain-containing protein [Roseimaritima ulvae]|uniref:Cyanophycinase n=1 Tax=Roseimaritima ulvae TaxID=980254 RepID=A0A5B9QSB9_9BACT|nr:Type 1 glutamine amidotransferase-like domain-containing protein [Roseimaritima ulvae]QEG42007.1 Cyanophycinase [Roseimaritima ulvae]